MPADTPLPGQVLAVDTLPGRDDTYSAPTPRGSFRQIDRDAVRQATEQWQASAPSPGEQMGSDTAILAGLAEIQYPTGQDPQLTLLLALGDSDGLDPAGLGRFAEDLSTAAVFSTIVQPQVDIAMNDALTGALISLQGTANAALDDVYWRIETTLPDAGGDSTDLSHNLAIWNTDLL